VLDYWIIPPITAHAQQQKQQKSDRGEQTTLGLIINVLRYKEQDFRRTRTRSSVEEDAADLETKARKGKFKLPIPQGFSIYRNI